MMDCTVTLSVLVCGVSNCHLSLYLDIAGLCEVLEKRSRGYLKVLEKVPELFYKQESGNPVASHTLVVTLTFFNALHGILHLLI